MPLPPISILVPRFPLPVEGINLYLGEWPHTSEDSSPAEISLHPCEYQQNESISVTPKAQNTKTALQDSGLLVYTPCIIGTCDNDEMGTRDQVTLYGTVGRRVGDYPHWA